MNDFSTIWLSGASSPLKGWETLSQKDCKVMHLQNNISLILNTKDELETQKVGKHCNEEKQGRFQTGFKNAVRTDLDKF